MRDIESALHPVPQAQALAPDSRSAWAWVALLMAGLLASCAAPVPPPVVAPPPLVVVPAPPPPVSTLPAPDLISQAGSPLEYRKDGARHIYERNTTRIYKGQLPPLMHAVGVLQVEVDGRGNVRNVNWMRAPSHVPDVMREIERTVRAAAPFPAPVRMGGVTYTDVWLWDKSGNFQLDTLTEGQRSK
jgi:protein TonB